MKEYEDQNLVKEYIKGNKTSLNFLIEKYFRQIYNFVHHYTYNNDEAEDITQEVFVKVWKNIKKYKENKSFKVWLYTIAKNTAIDFLRKKKSLNFSDFEKDDNSNDFLENIKDEKLISDEILEKKDLANTLNNAIEKLSIKYKTVLLLHHVEEMTFKEISQISKESIDTIKSRYRRALIMLKDLLK